jgi:hypothetical protein
MLEIFQQHFWAIWWLTVIVAMNLPDALVVIHRDGGKHG